MTMLERLLHGLTLGGSVIQRGANDGPFVITVYKGRRLDPPVRLFVTAEDFDALLRVMADEGVQELWPDVEPIIAAYRLFTVHLMEEFGMAGRILTELRVSERGLKATATPLPRRVYDPADGPFEWIAGPRADRKEE
jgi:hypothetical protein